MFRSPQRHVRKQLHALGLDDAQVFLLMEDAMSNYGRAGKQSLPGGLLTYFRVGPSVAFAFNGQRIGFIPYTPAELQQENDDDQARWDQMTGLI